MISICTFLKGPAGAVPLQTVSPLMRGVMVDITESSEDNNVKST